MPTKEKEVKPEVKEEVVEEVKATKEAVKYFRCRAFSGLTICLNANVTDPTMIEEVRFTAIAEKYQGDAVKVGYLKTSDPRVIERCENDTYIEEIEENEFPKQIK